MSRGKAGAYADEWKKMWDDFSKPPCPWVCRGCKNCTCKCRCKEPDILMGKTTLSPDTAYYNREMVIG